MVVGTTVFKPDKYLIPSLAALIKEIPLMMHGPEELRQILHHVLADREHGLGDLQVTVDADAENLLCSSTDGNAKIMLRFLEREVFRQIAFHKADPAKKDTPLAVHITRPQIASLVNDRLKRKSDELRMKLRKKDSSPSVIA